MTRRVKIRGWTVIFFFSFDTRDEGKIINSLLWAGAPDFMLSKVSDNVRSGNLNEGFCYSNPMLRRSVVGIGKSDSGPEFLDTAIHEIVHVAQHMAEKDGIDPFSEEFAYIAGDISREISRVVCEMSCPHCRGEM